MIITATIQIERQQLERILAGSDLDSLKEIAERDLGIDLSWINEKEIEIRGSMAAITKCAEEWRPTNLTLTKYTEDDEL